MYGSNIRAIVEQYGCRNWGDADCAVNGSNFRVRAGGGCKQPVAAFIGVESGGSWRGGGGSIGDGVDPSVAAGGVDWRGDGANYAYYSRFGDCTSLRRGGDLCDLHEAAKCDPSGGGDCYGADAAMMYRRHWFGPAEYERCWWRISAFSC